MDFNVTRWEKFIGTVSDSTLQLIFQKLSLVGIWCCIIEYPQVSKKAIRMLLPFLTVNLYEAEILHILQPEKHITAD